MTEASDMLTFDERIREHLADARSEPPLSPQQRVAKYRHVRVVRRRRRLVGVAAAALAAVATAVIAFPYAYPAARHRTAPVQLFTSGTNVVTTQGVPRQSRDSWTPDPTPTTPASVVAALHKRSWRLLAISDDDMALLVEAVVPFCRAFDHFQVDETPASVTVSMLLREPNDQFLECLSNSQREFRQVLELASPLNNRTLVADVE